MSSRRLIWVWDIPRPGESFPDYPPILATGEATFMVGDIECPVPETGHSLFHWRDAGLVVFIPEVPHASTAD